MSTGRKLGIGFLSFIFTLLLFGTVMTSGFATTFSDRENPKKWLDESGVYSAAVDSLLAQLEKISKQDGGAGQSGDAQEQLTIPIDRPEIQSAIKNAFSPQFLEDAAEQFINGTYDWLEGKTEKPRFRIDFTPAKTSFVLQVTDYLKQRLNSLPACTSVAQAQTFDPFTVECRPPGLNIDAEAQRVSSELLTSEEFLPDTVFTADNTFKDEQTGKSAFDNLAELPKVYQLSQILPFIFGTLALLGAVGIFFLHPDKRKGAGKLAYMFGVTGVILLIGALLTNAGFNKLRDQLINENGDEFEALKGSLLTLLQKINGAINQVTVKFAIAFIVLAAGTLVYLFFTRGKNGQKGTPTDKPAESKGPENTSGVEHADNQKTESKEET